MGNRARLAVYVALTVMLPLTIIALAGLVLIDPSDRVLLGRLAVLGAVVASLVTYISLRVRLRSVPAALEAMTLRARAISVGHIGDFGPVPERGMRELAALGRAFNEMYQRVRDDLDELERSQGEFRRSISRLGDTFASTHDLTTISEVVVEAALLVVGARTAVLWTLDGPVLAPTATSGEGRVRGTVGMGDGLAGAVANDQVARIGGPDERAASEPHHQHAMAVAVSSSDRLHGVVAVYGRNPPRPYQPDDLATLTSLVRQAGTAIENTFLHDEASRLSATDGLTGAANRRELEERGREELDRSLRFGDHMAFVIVDLDDFKTVNDTHGHQAGDAVLQELVRRLGRATRDVDTVARYGGEEFVLVLPRTDMDGACIAAAKLRRVITTRPFSVGSLELPVTASIGVAAYPESAVTYDALIAAADEALYRAKAAGKNRVERAPVAPMIEVTPTPPQDGP